MHPDATRAQLRLQHAQQQLNDIFRGMTAHPDETNCTCHWGSDEELALLKVPDVELEPDLLRRTWEAVDWTDHAAVLRRILPQFTAALTAGRIDPVFGMHEVGRCFDRGHWQQWPDQQSAAVREFLRSWWECTLTDPDPVVPAREVFALCAEATGEVGPWLKEWERQTHDVAGRHLVEAVDQWEYELLADGLPWDAWENGEEMYAELTAWLLRHAPHRLREHGASEQLLHCVRLLGVHDLDRWEDPHWPGHRY